MHIQKSQAKGFHHLLKRPNPIKLQSWYQAPEERHKQMGKQLISGNRSDPPSQTHGPYQALVVIPLLFRNLSLAMVIPYEHYKECKDIFQYYSNIPI